MNSISSAVVAIERPARFGKQLVSHMSRKNGGQWSAERNAGWIALGEHRADVVATETSLDLRVEAPVGQLDALEEALARHLVRFAADQELQITWRRS